MRSVPAVRPVAAIVSATAASISMIIGAMRSWRRDPAIVGATLRVVAVEQPHAEPGFELAYGLAQRRGDSPR